MGKGRLEAFSDGVLAIIAAAWVTWIALALVVAVALLWLIPDKRIERALQARGR